MGPAGRIALLPILALLIGAAVWLWHGSARIGGPASHPVPVQVPRLSALAEAGKAAFDDHCAGCHGANAAGTDSGPPLVHTIYHPGHHADGAFLLAVKSGVRQHHWSYGDMPPQPQVDAEQIAAIVRYVRELQQANGIGARQNGM